MLGVLLPPACAGDCGFGGVGDWGLGTGDWGLLKEKFRGSCGHVRGGPFQERGVDRVAVSR